MKHLFLSLTTFALLIYCSCSDEGTSLTVNKGLDTTSHDFIWQTFEFGKYPSILHDVAIVNENDIWAVGEIHTDETGMFDSLGNWIDPYNAMHWDGKDWKFMRFKFLTFCNQTATGIYPANSIISFDSNNIFISSGSQLTKWNGKTQEAIECVPVSINNIWGTSANNYFIVGAGGSIAWYNGQKWTNLESGTDINLTDIWGSPDGSIIWVAGYDVLKGSILLRNNGSGFEKVAQVTFPLGAELQNIISYPFRTIWTDNPDTIYVGSVGRIYKVPLNYTTYAPENKWFDYRNEPGLPNQNRAIRGNSRNDIFVAGFQNEIRHFNGKNWHKYNSLLTNSGYWYALAVKGDVVAAVGETSGSIAAVAIGIRSN